MQRYQHLRKYGIRWLIIFICYAVFGLVMFCIIYLAGPTALYENYGPRGQWILTMLRNDVKCTIVYYFLIFWIFLPIVRSVRLKTIFIKLPQFVLFFLLLTGYEYFFAFKTKNSVSERQNLTFNNWIFWELLIGTVVTLISLAVAITLELRAKAERQRELEKGKLMAELAAIKYQINPHFLFNSLSFIYTRAIGQNKEVAQAVTLLSEIMRYALREEEDKDGLVQLSTELDHMKNVIEMNQMRFSHRLKIRFLEDIDELNVRIPPLILITLLENALKHGELSDEKHPLDIKLEVARGKLWFYIQNKKKKGMKELSNGIGLTNVQQRLQLMYGIKHSLQIKEDDQYYLAELTINL